MNYGFESGVRVRVVGPTLPDDDGLEVEPEAGGTGGRESVLRLLEWMTGDGADAERAGRRALLLAYLVRAPGRLQTQRQLAAQLGISPARVNALLAEIRGNLGLARL